jgi:lysophospholipase L1-like esterase
MAGLDMSVFVCDYDHNAPNPEHLAATHEPLYRAIREKHPTLPIIFITRPSVLEAADRKARLDVIKATYDKAVAEGDENVWFLDASEFFPFGSNEHTVDNCHPTDLGFYLMAKGIEKALREALAKVKM